MSPTRILIVEDEAVVARDIAPRLALLGYEPVAEASWGAQALVLADQLRPDLVLMEIQLAGEMDAVSAARAIRDRFAIPVVFLTALAADATLQRAKVTEPFGYIIKPVEDRELHTVIEMALYKHQAETRLRNSQEELRRKEEQLLAANTRLEQAAAQAREMAVRIEAADRAKSEFLTNVSHEIRTPMTVILGFSDLLASPNVSYEERREFIAGIRRNGKALLELIGNILDLSHVAADRLTLEKADCSLRQMIDDALSAVRIPAEKKGLALELNYAFPLPETIHTDPVRLRQVLTHLIGNAVKFTQRGAVRITLSCTEGADGSGRVQFAVSDTGIGIPAEKIEDLFQPFTQVDASASRRYGGTGLGLAICKRLAEVLGGDVQVTSRLGVGSTFTLTIDAGQFKGVRMLQSPQVPAIAEAEPSSHARLGR
ncbi:MAG: ATP-binding protein [Thermoguttaceae bacterium]